ncbi:hypothetical protein ACFY0R_18370 [Streptomyces sp. NPDC001633]|uniref:hypothetical protein n=1 Tax=Streptomyces sp. NPDC001633 TaxID=3364595 RepID=UPI0036AA702B
MPRRAGEPESRRAGHPVRDAGLFDLVDVPDAGSEVAPGFRLRLTPGHTPGQVAVELRSGAHSAVITGDCVHHPVQLHRSAITSCVDIDPGQAVRSRRELIASLADTETLLLGGRFPPPTAGLVTAEAGAYRLFPVPGVSA